VGNTQKIMVLGTGGTIAGTASALDAGTLAQVNYRAAQWGVAQLLAAVPELARAAAGNLLAAEQIAQIDSKDMTHAVWTRLALRCAGLLADADVTGIVITHGTDTLEETAWFLANVLHADKPVVLPCAMRPATALAADGPQNLLDAVTLAASGSTCGVVVLAAGVIHSAQAVTKVHPLRLDAFDSGDDGPLGWVEAGRIRWAHGHPPLVPPPAHVALLPNLHAVPWPRVEIIVSHAGADGALVDGLMHSGIQGIVVTATGNGTLHMALEQALRRAAHAGVHICIATRCPLGKMTLPSPAEAEAAPRWQYAVDLSAVKARIRLLLELLQHSLKDSP